MTETPYRRWLHLMADNLSKIDSSVDPETVDVVVCRRVTYPLLYPDNLVSSCSKCFSMVQFRPHAPKTPRRLCDDCAGAEIEKRGGEVGFVVTEKTLADIAMYMKKKQQ